MASEKLPNDLSYDYIMYVCPDVTNFMNGAAWGQKPGSATWYPSEYASNADVMVHELGHNLGHGHSGDGDTRDGNEYDDATCHMGNLGGFRDESKKFCFNAAKTYQNNWFPEYYTTVTPSSANYSGELVGIDDVVNSKIRSNQELVVKIQGSGETSFYMMFNRKKGVNSDVGDGDLVHIVASDLSSRAKTSTKVAALSEGQVYTRNNWANTGKALKIKVCRYVFNNKWRKQTITSIKA